MKNTYFKNNALDVGVIALNMGIGINMKRLELIARQRELLSTKANKLQESKRNISSELPKVQNNFKGRPNYYYPNVEQHSSHKR